MGLFTRESPLCLSIFTEILTDFLIKKREKSAAETTDFPYICCAFRLFFVSLIFTLKKMIRNGHSGIFIHEIVIYSGYNGLKTAFLYVKYKNFRNSSPSAPARIGNS